jgi:peptidyl-prolyl cis-trans isomerase B (cyclophilin B)
MSSNPPRGRRVPPKSRAPRPADLPAADLDAGGAAVPTGPRPGTRAANRAAKRASGVRPKQVRGQTSARGGRQSNTVLLVLAIGAVVIGAAVIALGNPFGTPAASPSASAGAVGSAAAYGDGTCPTSQPAELPAGESRLVTIETSLGTIVIRVDGALSPIATGNFVALAECEYYDGVVFHRLVPGFVIQGGDPEGTGSGAGPGYGIQDEPIIATYHRGTVAMARTSQPNSQGSQFFIVLADEAAGPLTNVDPARGYAILGEVVSGMDVVDAIAAMPNSGEQSGNAALEPVAMTRVTVGDAPAATSSPGASAVSSAPTSSPVPATTP